MDKITILEIKLEQFQERSKLENVNKEMTALKEKLFKKNVDIEQIEEEVHKLKQINIQLWEIEDAIRLKESKKEFDEEFIELARSVYFTNDERAEVKKEINLKLDSELVEEKSYADYA